MGRHTAAPTQPVPTQGQPEPTFGPITDPLLLDAVERELGRTRTAPHAAQLRAQLPVQPTAEADDDDALDDGSSPPSQPVRVQFGTRVPMRFAEDEQPDDEDGGTAPVPSAFSTVRSPAPAAPSMFGPTPFPRPAQGPAWSAVDPLPAPAATTSALPVSMPLSAPAPVAVPAAVAEPEPRTDTIVPARSMTLAPPEPSAPAAPEDEAAEAPAEQQGNPLTFWIVVGVSMIAVLTLVALLPF
jgi:hypothetical protein